MLRKRQVLEKDGISPFFRTCTHQNLLANNGDHRNYTVHQARAVQTLIKLQLARSINHIFNTRLWAYLHTSKATSYHRRGVVAEVKRRRNRDCTAVSLPRMPRALPGLQPRARRGRPWLTQKKHKRLPWPPTSQRLPHNRLLPEIWSINTLPATFFPAVATSTLTHTPACLQSQVNMLLTTRKNSKLCTSHSNM